MVQPVEIPAAVDREPGHRVPPLDHEVPQLFGAVRAARQPGAHPHDRDRLVGGRRRHAGNFLPFAEQLGAKVGREDGGCRVVEDQRAGQVHPGEVTQSVAQLDRAERVESQALEGLLLVERVSVAVAEHDRGALLDQVHHHPKLLGGRQPGQPVRHHTFDTRGGISGRGVVLEFDPVPLVLERVSGQLGPDRRGRLVEHGRPVHGHTAHVQFRERGQHADGLRAVLAQAGDAALLRHAERAERHRGERPSRADLEERRRSVAVQ